LRFDRTSYDSILTDWIAGQFYGSFYAGLFNNSESIASSSITLENTQPPISSILASAEGAAFEIESVTRNESISWSSRTREVVRTYSSSYANPAYQNAISITPSEGGSPVEGELGSTIGFYVGMPVTFRGAVIGNLVDSTIYYVKTVVDLTKFTVSATISSGIPGTTFLLTDALVSSAGLTCYVGEVVYSTIVSIDYPGILTATKTEAATNKITVPLTLSGQGGTSNFYVGLPIYYTGSIVTAGSFVIGNTYTIRSVGTTNFVSCGASSNEVGVIFVATNIGSGSGTVSTIFGGIIENEPYFVTTIVDTQTFTMSTSASPTIVAVTATASGSNAITCANTLSLSINDPVIFNGMTISGVSTNLFGGLVSGTTYYVSAILPGNTTFSVSSTINGSNFTLSTQAAGTGTGCVFTAQKDTVTLYSATGSMTCTAGLPVSPGQITGQQFTFYPTSSQFVGVSGANGALINRTVTSALASGNFLALTTLSGGTTNFYVNLPIRFNSNYGGLVTGTTYYVIETGVVSNTVTSTSSSTNRLTVASTAGFYANMPVIFSSSTIGSVTLGIQYFVKTVVSSTEFTISDTSGGSVVILTTDNGLMVATGTPYMKVSTSVGGSSVTLVDSVVDTSATITQYPLTSPTFDVSYILGGYRAIIATSGSGYAVDNTITIAGTDLGGASPANDLVLVVDSVSATGQITSAIRSGTPNEVAIKYYLKTISATECEVYSDSLLTIPVNGNLFPYNGVRSTTVSATNATSNIVTLVDATEFSVNDPIVFTGNVSGGLQVGETYYITNKTVTISPEATITVSTTIGGTAFDITATATGLTFAVAKSGDYALLPEPFYFDQSIVRYNNKVYQCIVSNNDPEFIFGKWELLRSDSRKLNALDRIIGYYQPTINMPGLDLTQLVSGISYPNSTYLGNAFAPEDEFAIDTILQDEPFYPTLIDMKAVAFDGTTWFTVADTPEYSAVLVSADIDNWSISKISNEPLTVTDMIYADSRFVVTTRNKATPILISSDGITWTTNGEYTPYSSTPFDVVSYDTTSLDVASISLNSTAYFNGVFVAVGENIVTSTDTYVWRETYVFGSVLTHSLNGVAAIEIPNFGGLIAVGLGQELVGGNIVDVSVVVSSLDGYVWNRLPSTLSSYALNAVTSNDSTIVLAGNNGIRFTSVNGSNWVSRTAPDTKNINDVIYGNSLFVAVGDNGAIQTSSTGTTWSTQTSNTTENLYGIMWNGVAFVVVGDNNTVLESADGIVWTSTGVFTNQDPITYNVQGDAFTAGYGPEELVPGVVSDNLTMTIATRPGTNWPAVEYQHVGYEVVSIELAPQSGTQVTYSFANVASVPAQLTVSYIDELGLGVTIYQPWYSVDWINQTVTLASPLALTYNLRIDVYAVGNGDQLVKANSLTDPIRTNIVTGFEEIYLNCNYSAPRFSGSGIIRPGTEPLETIATDTFSSDDTIQCDSVENFILNSPITFEGSTFGNIIAGDIYYVKTISFITNKITVSTTVSSEHIAGPTFALNDSSGSMTVIIQVGTGAVWAPPIVYHNGTKLIMGSTRNVTATIASTNSVVTNTTDALSVNDPITFSDSMFGDVILPQTVYYIHSFVSSNEFAVTTTVGGSILSLTDATGSAVMINHNYAFGIADNGVSAKIIFAAQYDDTVDYLTYTVFGETSPEQYGYTVPQTQTFIADGSSTFTLINYVSGSNPKNAVVELDGLRLTETVDYTISSITEVLTLVVAPTVGQIVSVTSYNLTDRQYFHTEYGITGNTVANIINISNTISPPLAVTLVSVTTVGTDLLTCVSTTGFVAGQTIIFKGTSFDASVLTDGTVYFVVSGFTSTQFQISATSGGPVIALIGGTGAMQASVGGNPSVRVTTAIANNFAENDLVRIDGTLGSVQLNNNTYYAKIISSTQFDLYTQPYDPALTATNYPVTAITAYTSGGYVWMNSIFTLTTTTASNTTSGTNRITVVSTSELVVDTPIIFTGNTFGGIVAGTTYFVKEINSSIEFKISATQYGGEFVLSTAPGTMNVTQWEQNSVDRLWVTVNGYRIPSSLLKLNADNNLSILSTITSTDEVIITSMIPSATPNELVYMQTVDKSGSASVYRANTQTRTWLVHPLSNTDDTIYLKDISRVTNTIVQTVIAPAAVGGIISIGLTADKNLISQIAVYNNTTSQLINPNNYYIQVEELSPILLITSGVTVGDSLTISTVEGNLIYINGERIKFSSSNSVTNTLSGLQRGANGTGVSLYLPIYSEVYSVLSQNRLPQIQYNLTWNSNDYNATEGDPLQISNTVAAEFLIVDIS